MLSEGNKYQHLNASIAKHEFPSVKRRPNLQDVLLVGVQYEVEGLIPFWVDVIVYVLGPFSAFRRCWDEQFHVWVRSVHCTHTY